MAGTSTLVLWYFLKGYFKHLTWVPHPILVSFLLLLSLACSNSFPRAAVTNNYKLSGLKQHTLIHLQFWRPEVGNQYHWAEIEVLAGPRSHRRLQGRIHFLGFSSIYSCIPCIPWLVASSSIFTASSTPSSLSDSGSLFFQHTSSSLLSQSGLVLCFHPHRTFFLFFSAYVESPCASLLLGRLWLHWEPVWAKIIFQLKMLNLITSFSV